jgi:hypothetical protein
MTNNYGYNNGGAPASGYPQTEQYAPPQGVPPTYGGGANQGYYGQTSGVAEPPNAYQPYNK